MLVIRRIHVRFELRAPPEQHATAERVHGLYADACPLYRTLRGAIAISTELAFVEEQVAP